MNLGSDDTSNDFTDGNFDEDYEVSGSNQESEAMPNSHVLENEMDIHAFTDLTKKLEAQRLRNVPSTERLQMSEVIQSDLEVIDNIDNIDEEEWPIDRFLRLQHEQDMQDAGTSGRLTAPQGERQQRKSRQKTTPTENNVLVDELRTKQLALVNEQLELQKILQETALINRENASIAKEEARFNRSSSKS